MSDLRLAPRSETEACAIVAASYAEGSTICIEGGGSKRNVGRPTPCTRTVATENLSGIIFYEPAEMIVGVSSGTPLSVLVATLAQRAQRLPFEPPELTDVLGTSADQTIGGVVSVNASGPRRIEAGGCRDSLLGLNFINGKGDLIRAGGRVMKNVAGLDLARLMAGAWGTLGLVTSVVLRVLPIPERTATLVLEGLDLGNAIEAMAKALSSPFGVDGAAHAPARDGAPACTWLRVEGTSLSVDERLGALAALLRPFVTTAILSDAASDECWKRVRAVTDLRYLPDEALWRIVVPASRTHQAVTALSAMLPSARFLFDWGGGLVWCAVPADNDASASTIRDILGRHAGHATLLRAPTVVREAVPLFPPLPERLLRLQMAVKTSLDPKGILNPRRVYAEF